MLGGTNTYLESVKEAFIALAGAMDHIGNQETLLEKAKHENNWFTKEQIEFAARTWSEALSPQQIEEWLAPYAHDFPAQKPKKVGLILAGNLPFVGLHDLICVLASGHEAYVKQSSKDTKLTEWVMGVLTENQIFQGRIHSVDKISKMDAVIATGSSNSSRYFEYYFKSIPHIIRASRTSVAILDGTESEEDLQNLALDVFQYYGLGCRNVTKIFIPEGYDIRTVLPHFEGFNHYGNHHTYFNNYTYHKAIFLMNKTEHYDNGFLLIKPDQELKSPLGCIFYESYDDLETLHAALEQSEHIQCVVGKNLPGPCIEFGQSQRPGLTDYADHINTLDFLKNLS